MRISYKYALLLAVLCFLLISIPQITRPLVVDEVFWVEWPKFMMNDSTYRFMVREQTFQLPQFTPPGFLYTMYFYFLLGGSEDLVRIVPFIFSLLTMALIYLIALKTTQSRKIAILSICLFAIFPLAIQSSMVMDDDTGILTFIMTLFLYLYIRFEKALNLKNGLILSAVLSTSLLVKPITPVFGILAILIFQLLRKNLRKLAQLIIMSVTAGLFFVVEWIIYALLTGRDWLGFLSYAQHVLPNVSLLHYLINNILYGGLKIHIFWMLPPFLLILFIGFFKRFKHRKKSSFEYMDLLWIYASSIFIIHIFFGQSPWKFPAYMIPALPIFMVIFADLLIKAEIKIKFSWENLVAVILPVIFYTVFLQDPFMPPKTILQAIEITALFLAPFLASLIFGLTRKTEDSRYKTIITIAFLVFVSTAVYIDFIQLTANYSTGFDYGEEGVQETASWVKNHTSQNDSIIAPSYIAYRSSRRFYEIDNEMDSDNCINVLKKRGIKIAVLRGDWDLQYNPTLFGCLKKNYNETKFGIFHIYEIR